MTRRLAITLLALTVGACATLDYRAAYHSGPPSGHFDGLRFFNPEGSIGKGLLDVLKWRLTADTAAWPDAVPLPTTTAPAARVHGQELVVNFVGHATVLIQTAGLNILTDPTWSDRASPLRWAGPKRVTPPGIDFADLPPIDLVVLSHNHYDHMDLPTLSRLQQAHDPLVLTPLGNDAIIRAHDPAIRVQTLDWWQSVPVADAVRVHAVPVYHWSRRGVFDRNKALWSGFVVTAPSGNIYVAGDTGLGSGRFFREAAQRFGGFRLALIPVGAYEPRWFMKAQHVNPAEAVHIHRLLNARHSIGVHLRTFQLTDEGFDQPELELQAALADAEVSPLDFFTLPVGAQWTAPQEEARTCAAPGADPCRENRKSAPLVGPGGTLGGL